MLWIYVKRFKETGPIADQKYVSLDNLGQNIWNKIEKMQ